MAGSIVCGILGAVAAAVGIFLVNGVFFAIVICLAKILFMGSVSTELLVGLWALLTVVCSLYCLQLCCKS